MRKGGSKRRWREVDRAAVDAVWSYSARTRRASRGGIKVGGHGPLKSTARCATGVPLASSTVRKNSAVEPSSCVQYCRKE